MQVQDIMYEMLDSIILQRKRGLNFKQFLRIKYVFEYKYEVKFQIL